MLPKELKAWAVAVATVQYPEITLTADSTEFALIHAADRSIYRVDLAPLGKFLVLKIWLEDPAGVAAKKTNSSVTDEFARTLEAYTTASRVKGPKPSMAKPLAVSERWNAILLSGCTGHEFSKYLNAAALTWPARRAEIKRRFRLAGHWLARFHESSVEVERSIDLYNLRREHLKRMLRVITSKSDGESLWHAVGHRFDELLAAENSVEVALLHGNYALRNLLVDDNELSAIDFEDSRRDCVYYDLGQLDAEILVRGFIPTFFRTLIEEWRCTLLDSYGEIRPIRNRISHAYTGYHLVAFYYEHVRRGLSNPVDRYRSRHIRREIIRWLDKSPT